MKKVILTLTIILSSFALVTAQTEISGYLDSDSSDGISGAPAQYTFSRAIVACKNLVHDSKTDWYLPTYNEIALFFATDWAQGPGCVGTNCAWNFIADAQFVWTRQVMNDSDGNGACIIHIHSYYTGQSYANASNTAGYVRCVR